MIETSSIASRSFIFLLLIRLNATIDSPTLPKVSLDDVNTILEPGVDVSGSGDLEYAQFLRPTAETHRGDGLGLETYYWDYH
jgi:hypothetical protein